MAVDLAKLKVNDVIELRDGTRHVVSEVQDNLVSYSIVTTSPRSGCVPASKSFSWAHYANGKWCGGKEFYSGDIVRILPTAAPAASAAPAETQRTYESGAKRNTVGKTPYGFVPLDLLDGAAKVMAHGSTKYGRLEASHPDGPDENFRAGFPPLETLHSLLRHVSELQRAVQTEDRTGARGHLRDADSGQGHIHHVITSALLLLQSMRKDGFDV